MVHRLCRRLRLLTNTRSDTRFRPARSDLLASRTEYVIVLLGVQINDRIERINADAPCYPESEFLLGTNVSMEIGSPF